MKRKPAAVLAALLASLALVASSCGGNGESAGSAEQWADEFCTAVSSWTTELQRIGNEVGDPSSLDADSLRAAADDVGTATDSLVEDLRALGPPETESSEQVQDTLESLADTLEEQKTDIEEAVGDLSGLTDLPSAITAIGTSLTAMGTAFQAALEALEDADVDGELEKALESSDACDEISS